MTVETPERASDGPWPSVSVIVPVWNGAACIGACIDGLLLQDYPGRIELLVVDNGSSDATTAIVSQYQKVILVEEQAAGSYAARNRGLSLATGEVVAFTDADCVPSPGWLSAAVRTLRSVPGTGVVAGRVEVIVTAPDNIAELHDRYFAFRQDVLASQHRCVTANWVSPAAVIRDLGPFDQSLKSGGDWALAQKIAAAGYAITYSADAVVSHPARGTVEELLVKRRRVAGGLHDRAGTLKAFLRGQRAGLADTLRKLAVVLRRPELGPGQKFRLCSLILRIWLAFVTESIRLRAGGRSARS